MRNEIYAGATLTTLEGYVEVIAKKGNNLVLCNECYDDGYVDNCFLTFSDIARRLKDVDGLNHEIVWSDISTYIVCDNLGNVGYTGSDYNRAEADLEYNQELYPDDEWEIIIA